MARLHETICVAVNALKDVVADTTDADLEAFERRATAKLADGRVLDVQLLISINEPSNNAFNHEVHLRQQFLRRS